MALKLDFEKAFDTIDWDFLLQLLAKMNFDQKWIRWISVIFKSTRTSVLVNGVPTKEFSPNRGLRQGDPLSPLLFNLVAEVLHKMLIKGEQLGLFKALEINGNNFSLSHLQYADDTVVFINNDSDSVMEVKRILQVFKFLIGLKVNFGKSSLYGYHENTEDMITWSDMLECEIGKGDFVYLGANISASSKSVKFWDPLLVKMQKKLASWKSSQVTQAGRLVLLNAVLDSLPLYWLSLFRLPKTVEKKMDIIRKRFF